MNTQARFPAASRLLHWLMAAMMVAMLFIGVGMAASLSARYELLVSVHRPLGIAVFVLCPGPYREPVHQPAAGIARYGSIPAAVRRQGIARRTVCAHGHHAAGRLGHAVGGALSDRALWAAAAAADPAA